MITRAQPYYNYKTFLKKTYGCELYSIPLDLGYGCPNRDHNNHGGCTFCPESGARAQQTAGAISLESQITDAVDFAKRRYGAKVFAAYIQAFTGTFAAASKQRNLYRKFLKMHQFDALYVGTRPDCIDNETLDFLNELQEELDVRVELGIQTSNNQTLSRLNRGHTWEQSCEAIKTLNSRNIPAIAHVIIGLPAETIDDFLKTASLLADLPLSGLKIHNLHIIKNTALADEYLSTPFPLLNEHEYLDSLIEFIRRTDCSVPIIRIQTDTPADQLIAPNWSTSKGQLIDKLLQHMNWRLAYQGELTATPPPSPYLEDEPEMIITDDGSITLWNETFKEHYHTPVGARSEAIHKYIKPSMLSNTLLKQDIGILDVCFGLGYNTLEACKIAKSADITNSLKITALEIDHAVLNHALSIADDTWSKKVLSLLAKDNYYEEKNICIKLILGDARYTTTLLNEAKPFDIIFLDAFSTQRNSELWTVEFFSILRKLITPSGRLLTYSSSLPVISGLIEAGFQVGTTKNADKMRGGTIASPSADIISNPISNDVIREIKTSTRGIPYHDPDGTASNRDILKAREQVVKAHQSQSNTNNKD